MSKRIKGAQNRAAETRTLIISTARDLWSSKNFDTISLAEIAKTAGTAKGSVLAHFSQKSAILALFLAEQLAQLAETLADAPRVASSASSLVTAVRPLLSFMMRDRALVRLLTAESDADGCAEYLDPATEQLMLALIESFRAAGHADPQLAADVFMALATNVLIIGHMNRATDPADELERLSAVLFSPTP